MARQAGRGLRWSLRARRCGRSPIEGRMTLCNMATEFAAFTGMIAPDEATFDVAEAGRHYAPNGAHVGDQRSHRVARAGQRCRRRLFDREIVMDAAGAARRWSSWGTTPAQSAAGRRRSVPAGRAGARALAYMALSARRPAAGGAPDRRRPSSAAAPTAACPISQRAAAIVRRAACRPRCARHRRPPARLRPSVRRRRLGLDRDYSSPPVSSGANLAARCAFTPAARVSARSERVISSTNRNFESRQGPGTRTHIASPETVAASAVAGVIADARPYT